MTFKKYTSIVAVCSILALPLVGYSEDSSNTTSTTSPTSNATSTTPSSSAPTGTSTSTPAGTSTTTPTTDSSAAPTFQSTCVNAWMGRNTDIKDTTDFKNFGEKYCKCAETQQPLDTQEAVNKAAQVCMSRTLLVDAMDSVEEKIGLDKVTTQDIDKSCHDRWTLVYPKMDDNDKNIATSYCNCANPKLLDLAKKSAGMTDDAYYKEINNIAATCSGKQGK